MLFEKIILVKELGNCTFENNLEIPFFERKFR